MFKLFFTFFHFTLYSIFDNMIFGIIVELLIWKFVGVFNLVKRADTNNLVDVDKVWIKQIDSTNEHDHCSSESTGCLVVNLSLVKDTVVLLVQRKFFHNLNAIVVKSFFEVFLLDVFRIMQMINCLGCWSCWLLSCWFFWSEWSI